MDNQLIRYFHHIVIQNCMESKISSYSVSYHPPKKMFHKCVGPRLPFFSLDLVLSLDLKLKTWNVASVDCSSNLIT